MGENSSDGLELASWCEQLVLEEAYTLERIESRREGLIRQQYPPRLFTRTVDNIDVFMCPSDKPHPHFINQERHEAWSFEAHKYSYSLNAAVTNGETNIGRKPHLDKDATAQILSADSTWSWIHNFRAQYLVNPNAGPNTPFWWSNAIGVHHGNKSIANLVMRDGSVRSVKFQRNGDRIDRNEMFFGTRGEDFDAYQEDDNWD
jgi:hypothetical protein